MGKLRTVIMICVLLAAGGFSVTASTFGDMGLAEVRSLLETADASKASAPSAKEGVVTRPDSVTGCINVTAHDMMTKVYGFIYDDCTRTDCMEGARRVVSLTPDDEGEHLWLDSADGYRLCYSGVAPDVSAMARIAPNDSVAEYGFFFLFPYDEDVPVDKEQATRQQADFSGSLLQEMADMQMPLTADADTDDLFDVNGDYQGRDVNVRLLDDPVDDRYILILSVRK